MGRDGSVCDAGKVQDLLGGGKLLAPKIDGLWKHAGRRRALTNFGSVKKGEHYFLSSIC